MRVSPNAGRFLGAWATWIYLVIVVFAALVLQLGTDRWWLGTVIAFSPRWLIVVPLAALIAYAAAFRRRLLWPLAAAAIIAIGPILGWNMPLSVSRAAEGVGVRVLTCNVGGDDVDASQLMRLATERSVDIVMLQECSDGFDVAWPENWFTIREGSLVIASRFPLDDGWFSRNDHPPTRWPPTDALGCRVSGPAGTFSLCNVHLRSPREGLGVVADRWTIVDPARKDAIDRGIDARDKESGHVRRRIAEERGDKSIPSIVAGDFNLPVHSAIYRRHWADLANAFSQRGWGFGATKVTRIGPVRFGTRIDHVLTTHHWSANACWIDDDVGSDHLPVIAELTMRASDRR